MTNLGLGNYQKILVKKIYYMTPGQISRLITEDIRVNNGLFFEAYGLVNDIQTAKKVLDLEKVQDIPHFDIVLQNYRQIALKNHPDRHPENEKDHWNTQLKLINAAFEYFKEVHGKQQNMQQEVELFTKKSKNKMDDPYDFTDQDEIRINQNCTINVEVLEVQSRRLRDNKRLMEYGFNPTPQWGSVSVTADLKITLQMAKKTDSFECIVSIQYDISGNHKVKYSPDLYVTEKHIESLNQAVTTAIKEEQRLFALSKVMENTTVSNINFYHDFEVGKSDNMIMFSLTAAGKKPVEGTYLINSMKYQAVNIDFGDVPLIYRVSLRNYIISELDKYVRKNLPEAYVPKKDTDAPRVTH